MYREKRKALVSRIFTVVTVELKLLMVILDFSSTSYFDNKSSAGNK